MTRKVPPDVHPPRLMKETFDAEEDNSSSYKTDCSSPNNTLLLDNSDKGTDIYYPNEEEDLFSNRKIY